MKEFVVVKSFSQFKTCFLNEFKDNYLTAVSGFNPNQFSPLI